jgi:ribulose-5-phosphate 4-epimerase/fuculose-1-phosphate aldolase
MKIHPMFHIALLEPYHASTIPRRICEPPPPIEVNGEQKYEVENVFDSRISNDQLQYLIHWHGYDVSEHTWEPTNHLMNVMEKVKKFHQRYLNKPKATPCGTCR